MPNTLSRLTRSRSDRNRVHRRMVPSFRVTASPSLGRTFASPPASARKSVSISGDGNGPSTSHSRTNEPSTLCTGAELSAAYAMVADPAKRNPSAVSAPNFGGRACGNWSMAGRVPIPKCREMVWQILPAVRGGALCWIRFKSGSDSSRITPRMQSLHPRTARQQSFWEGEAPNEP